MKTLLSATLLVAAALPVSAQGTLGGAPTFRSGDLCYASNALFGPSSGNVGILLIDPVSGDADVLLGPVGSGSSFSPNMAYDPFRDRVITSLALDLVNRDTYLVDAAGGTVSVGLLGQTVTNFAPTGDGRIYMTIEQGLAGDIHYIDAAGTLHQLMDQTGSAPFQLDPLAGAAGFSGMIYDPGTQALFVATLSSTFVCTSFDSINVHKVPLTADGSQVAGPAECTDFQVDPIGASENPEGWSRGPAGDLFLVVDTNSNNQQPRMLRVDPETLGVTPYASNGSYIGAAATNAGAYSHVRGQGAIVDSFAGVLRFYGPGEVGDGTPLVVSGVPGTTLAANGQQATLTEIGPIGPQYGLSASPLTLSVSAGGSQNWTLDTGATFAGETYAVLGSLTGWTPSIPIDAALLPLVIDTYTLFTLNNANSATLPGSVGVLGPQGDATAALVVPAGAVGPGAVGAVAYHAALVVDAGVGAVFATNAVSLELVP